MNSSERSLGAAPLLQLGRYRLIIELAQGGMGNVYLAVAEGPAGFTKMSVIKELKPALVEEEGFLEMFLDEARLSARLNHPNVVQTNEVNVENGRAFLAMEYLDGQSLARVRSRLGRERKLPLGAHVRLLAEACNGLHYAHELRDLDGVPLEVVHRDVSPHNVFVTYDGQVKLVDFGVAKAMSQSHETNVGVVKGKIPYMAPEHARSERLDRRADIFAIGVLLWEAVAGRRMWAGHRAEAILHRLMSNDVPSLGDAVPDLDVRLANIVARATAPFPEARYATADMLRRDLESWLSTRSDGGHGSLRELGDEMTRGFAAERAEIASAVNAQLQLLRDAAVSGRSWNVGLVRLNDPGASGSHPTVSQSQPVRPVSERREILPRLSSSAPSVGPDASRPGSHGSVSIVMSTSPSIEQRPSRARTGVVLAAAAGALLAGAVGVVLALARSGAPAAVPAPPSSATAVAEPPPPEAARSDEVDASAATVRVRLGTSPPTARLYLDGLPLASNPHEASLRMDAMTHRVRAEAPGYVTKTELVAFDHDVDLTLTLERATGPAFHPRPSSPRPETSERPERPEPAPSSAKPSKHQRPIDTDLEAP